MTGVAPIQSRNRVGHAEAREQEVLIQWAAYTRLPEHLRLVGYINDFLVAIPNGTHLAGDAAARERQMGLLKRAGLKPGAADLLLALPNRRWHALFIEMKKPRELFRSPREAERAVSPDQRVFRDRMILAGYDHDFCYGWHEAKVAIDDYLANRR